MKTIIRAFLMFVALLITLGSARAATFTFTPTPNDLWDLDHYKYYKWGINWSIPTGQVITEATLKFDSINNWKYEPNANFLYMHLLDTVPVGSKRFTDNQGGGDNFSGQGKLIGVYTDNSTAVEDISYNFSSLGLLPSLTAYAADGNFGFGFDPDCHYFNCGITFIITTIKSDEGNVPEPSGLAALLSGAGGLAGLFSRKRRSI